jgi:hypothetical protein
MDPNTPTHYAIHVYDDGPPPHNEPTETTLCPGARNSPTQRTQNLDQVTCRRCVQLLDVIGLDAGTKKAGG